VETYLQYASSTWDEMVRSCREAGVSSQIWHEACKGLSEHLIP
jgi:hypothetical protein